MKTSFLLIILIAINTSAIISEPITKLIQGINIWWFLGLEFALLLGYYINKTIKELRAHCEVDCNNLNLFVVNGKQNLK